MSFLENWLVKAGQLKRKAELPGRFAILDENQELRRNPDAIQNLSFAGPCLQIPEPDLYALWRKYPELNVADKMTRRNAWLKFIGSSEADPYRVRERNRKRAAPANAGRISTAH